VQLACAAHGAPTPAKLRAWARAAARRACTVTLRIVGAAEARRLNRQFRGRNAPANVLSFCYEGPSRGIRRGDIALCHPLLVREARAQGKTLAAHYAHLVVHGMLHLQGFDHTRRAAAKRMEREEVRILRRAGFDDPYVLRAGRSR
jgi:probable rRNA maturation factor